jgi:hypothetical protein
MITGKSASDQKSPPQPEKKTADEELGVVEGVVDPHMATKPGQSGKDREKDGTKRPAGKDERE